MTNLPVKTDNEGLKRISFIFPDYFVEMRQTGSNHYALNINRKFNPPGYKDELKNWSVCYNVKADNSFEAVKQFQAKLIKDYGNYDFDGLILLLMSLKNSSTWNNKTLMDTNCILFQSESGVYAYPKNGPILEDSPYVAEQSLFNKVKSEGNILFEEGMPHKIFRSLQNEWQLYFNRSRAFLNDSKVKKQFDSDESLADLVFAYQDMERSRRIGYFIAQNVADKELSTEHQEISSLYMFARSHMARTLIICNLFELDQETNLAGGLYNISESLKLGDIVSLRLEDMMEYSSDKQSEDYLLECSYQIEQHMDVLTNLNQDWLKMQDYFRLRDKKFKMKDLRQMDIPVMERTRYIGPGEPFEMSGENILNKAIEINAKKDYLGFKVKGSFLFEDLLRSVL